MELSRKMRIIPTFWFCGTLTIEPKWPSARKKRSTEQSYRSIMGYRSGNQNCGKSCAEYRQVAPNRKPLLPVVLCGHEKNWAWLDLLRYVPMTMLLPGMPSENAGWPSPNTHPIEKTENHQTGCHLLTSHNNKNIIYLTFYIKIQSTFVVIFTTRLKIQTNPKDGATDMD